MNNFFHWVKSRKYPYTFWQPLPSLEVIDPKDILLLLFFSLFPYRSMPFLEAFHEDITEVARHLDTRNGKETKWLIALPSFINSKTMTVSSAPS